ncbi:hypothetical protein XACS582_13910004 [Xanthomonas citri pv. citri]|uniref:Uncharacterized protein n=1 Tax=Xanthomonas citri pv. citri TaxID=611301 RepID=A0A0U5FAB1_XANCI|nr:hypothetical protein XAC2911_1310026 [Xanthomonas citri pv. citri]CEE42700.1 hypothetical protein XAC902_670022 [Xanthomonas citri pv. citri]CEE45709.1 hypothetical protein XAC908_740014 [Xanthomonas citri pv. citri]CEE56352.1 hypothetical protein XACW160_1580006 [Xanthomonas citri pv. citri]CEE57599.1 hypothetical protein XACS584_1790004 [Xanthomonas citri pv. citri]
MSTLQNISEEAQSSVKNLSDPHIYE